MASPSGKQFTSYCDTQIGKFAKCAGDLSFVQIACTAVFVSLNNSSIVSFCCFTNISRLEPWLKFKVCGREIGRARQTFQSGVTLRGNRFSIFIFLMAIDRYRGLLKTMSYPWAIKKIKNCTEISMQKFF